MPIPLIAGGLIKGLSTLFNLYMLYEGGKAAKNAYSQWTANKDPANLMDRYRAAPAQATPMTLGQQIRMARKRDTIPDGSRMVLSGGKSRKNRAAKSLNVSRTMNFRTSMNSMISMA